MRALVTGGGGFLGNAIVRFLRARGDEVRSFSRANYPALEALGVTQFRGDLANLDVLRRATAGCDVLFHVAAKTGFAGPLREFHRVNVEGTNCVLEACKWNAISRLVYTSSPSVVFAGTDMEGVDESVPYPKRYDAHYPRTKALAEQQILAANGPSLATVALRPHLIWGPGDNHLVPRILERGKAGKLRQIGNVSKLIDSVYIDNAADAHIRAADLLAPSSPIAGKVYFITNGEPVPTWDLINCILKAGGLKPVTRSIPYWNAWLLGWLLEKVYQVCRPSAEPPMTRFLARQLATAHWFDLSAARRDLNYQPRVSIAEGLRRLQGHLSAKST
jgi:nucleoside-diphosphate-sugar epimerase